MVTLAEKEKSAPRMKRVMKKGDGPMKWIEKDGDNVRIEKRIHRVPDQMFDKDMPHLQFIVI